MHFHFDRSLFSHVPERFRERLTRELVMDSANLGQLNVASDVTLAGALTVSFGNGYTPSVGTVLKVLSGKAIHGRFTSVSVKGCPVTTTYTDTSVQIRIDA